jgi:hypothetical protein
LGVSAKYRLVFHSITLGVSAKFRSVFHSIILGISAKFTQVFHFNHFFIQKFICLLWNLPSQAKPRHHSSLQPQRRGNSPDKLFLQFVTVDEGEKNLTGLGIKNPEKRLKTA